jgi:hypothetical protein
MNGRPIGPCPSCNEMARIKLIPAQIVTKATHPKLIGHRGTYNEIVPRTITWDCTNKECEQSEGKPILADWLEREREKVEEKMRKDLAEFLKDKGE